MTSLADTVLARQQELAAERQTWEHAWTDIADFVLPRRASFTSQPEPGAARVKGGRVFDSTAIHANELLAAGLHGMLTNPAERWFSLKLTGGGDQDGADVTRWLEEVERRMQSVFSSPTSRFAPAIHELYLDLGAFGTAAMFVGERLGEAGHVAPGGILFRTYHLAEIYPSEGAFGQVDTVYRRFSWSARQMVERWGQERVSEAVQRAVSANPEKTFEVVHGVFPRRERTGAPGTWKPWASVYVEAASHHVLEDGGFDDFPYLVPRWAKVPGERFGRSPAWTMLPDIKMLNAMSKTVIKAAQKLVDPPLLVADDGVIQPVTTVPGGLNYGGVDPGGRQLIQPLTTGARIDIGLDMMEQRRGAIRDAFFAALMQTPESPQRTATQVLQETEERMRLMSPVLGRLQSELLGPLVRRVFNLLKTAGQLPAPPLSVLGRRLDVDYVSPIVRAQRASEMLGVTRTFEAVVPFAQMEPGVWDIFDLEALARRAADVNGVPAATLRSEAEVARRRAEREAEAVQAADALAQRAGAPGGGAEIPGAALPPGLVGLMGGLPNVG